MKLQKPDGRTIKLAEPVEFYGKYSFNHGGKNWAFETVAARICEHFAIPSLFQIDQVRRLLSEREPSTSISALEETVYLASEYQSFKSKYTASLANPRLSGQVGSDAAAIVSSINRACLVGYLWARAETQLRIRPLAESALRSDAGSAKGGKKSGQVRKAKAAKTWHLLVKAEAFRLRKKGSELSQPNLAAEIKDNLPDPAVPGIPTIVLFIRALDRARKLPPRQAKRRRKGR